MPSFPSPLENASDALDICERNVAKDFDRKKLLNRITEAYRKAPLFQVVSPVIERIVRHPDRNLFRFLHNSLVEVCAYLAIDTEIVLASSFQINPSLKGQDMVIALCRQAGADVYVNAIGGVDLIHRTSFAPPGWICASFAQDRSSTGSLTRRSCRRFQSSTL